jgi:tetratricopeptide (TPR) repeat protein
LVIEEKIFGRNHPRIAHTVVDLADLMQQAGALEEAAQYAQRAVDIFQAVGESELDIANAMSRLGDIQREQGFPGEAIDNLRTALQLVEQKHGRRALETAHLRTKLGAALRLGGQTEEAIAELRLAVALNEAVGDHSQLAAALNNLGNALDDAGRHRESLGALERCVAITREMYGDRHPRFAGSLVNLGIAYGRAGDESRAERLFMAAVQIDPKAVTWVDDNDSELGR